MYERRKQPLLSRGELSKRVGRHGPVAFAVLIFRLGIPVLGLSFLCTSELDRFAVECVDDSRRNGPGRSVANKRRKNFASLYVLFSGLAFVGIVSVLLAPFVHRMLHRFHAEKRE